MPAARGRARARRLGVPNRARYASDSDADSDDSDRSAMENVNVDDFFADYVNILAQLDNNSSPPRPNGAADHDSGDSGLDSDDSGIVALEQAPAHLRPALPGTPIMVSSDDDDDDDDDDYELQPQRPPKRPASGSFELLESPPKARQRVDAPAEQPVAGPSNAPDMIVTDIEYLIPVVLEVIPDACTEWVRDNLERMVEKLKHKTATPGQAAIDRVINAALEMEHYPRAGDGEKTVEAEKEKGDYKDPNYREEARVGPEYYINSQSILETMFTSIPVSFIREAWRLHGKRQLVPTYLYLHGLATAAHKPYKELKRGRLVKGKSRAVIPEEDSSLSDEGDGRGGVAEFYCEYAFLKTLMAEAAEKEQKDMAASVAKQQEEAEHLERRQQAVAAGRSRECGCCFDEEALEDLVACPEGHMFCRQCVASLAENKLGEQLTNITCMDMSQCDAPFAEAVLADVCGEKTMSLYHRLRQMKDLEMAAIEGLESCPYCPFAMVIENPDEKLFRCFNPDCNKVTCRKCKRPDHIPKRCEEVEEAFKLDKRHVIEEAMSAALMRRCPKCTKPYLKESGCNKITKEIPEDYAHFDQMPGRSARTANKCQLWDTGNENQAEADRIRNARDEALKAAREAAEAGGLQLNEADLNVDAPAAAPQGPGPYGAGAANRLAALRMPMFGGLDAPGDALNRARALADAQRRLREYAQLPNPHALHNEIFGFGRMLANHENAMNAHQAAVVAHGDHLVEQIARLAPRQELAAQYAEQLALGIPRQPPPHWLPVGGAPGDLGGVAHRAFARIFAQQAALGAQAANLPAAAGPARPHPPAPAAGAAADRNPPPRRHQRGPRLREAEQDAQAGGVDAELEELRAELRAQGEDDLGGLLGLPALRRRRRARLEDLPPEHHGEEDIGGIFGLPLPRRRRHAREQAGGGEAAAVQPPHRQRGEGEHAVLVPESDDEQDILRDFELHIPRRRRGQAGGQAQRADELLAVLGRQRNRPGPAGRQ